MFEIAWISILLPSLWFLGIHIAKVLNINFKLASILYIWHTMFSVIYYRLTLVKISDASTYYDVGLNPDWEIGVGTDFINFISGILVSGLGMGILSTFIVLGFVGYLGLLILAHLFTIHIPTKYDIKISKAWIYIALFFPSLSFWSSYLGKDSIALFAVCLSLLAAANITKRYLIFAIAILLMMLVRPHVAAIMLVSVSMALLMSAQINILSRFALVSILGSACVIMIPFAIDYIGLSEGDITPDEYIMRMQSYGVDDSSGGLDLMSMPWPTRLFSYMFRPIFIDARNIEQLAASFENIVLFGLILFALFRLVSLIIKSESILVRYSYIYSCVMVIVLGNTAYNLGIAFRQKTMILPAIFILLLFVYGQSTYSRRQKATFNMKSDF